MNTSNVWYAALSVVADYSPMTYWEMSNGAVFWWTLSSRSQLMDDRFAEQPFDYSEIISITVFNEIRFRTEVLSCDWPSLIRCLWNVPGLQVEMLTDVNRPPATPPNQAIRLKVLPRREDGSEGEE